MTHILITPHSASSVVYGAISLMLELAVTYKLLGLLFPVSLFCCPLRREFMTHRVKNKQNKKQHSQRFSRFKDLLSMMTEATFSHHVLTFHSLLRYEYLCGTVNLNVNHQTPAWTVYGPEVTSILRRTCNASHMGPCLWRKIRMLHVSACVYQSS